MKRYACMPNPVVERGTHAITAVQPEHIEAIRLWRNAQIEVLRQDAPITPEQQVAYYEQRIWPTLDQAQPANILVTYLKGGEPVGYGGLVHIAWAEGHAEVSFLLAPEHIADQANYRAYHLPFLALIKALAFEELGFEFITTETFPHRVAHMANLEAAGFRREARPQDSVIATGDREDSIFHRCVKQAKQEPTT